MVHATLGPLTPGPRTLTLADAALNKSLDVSVDVRAGETAWVTVDFATSHVTTTTTRPGE